MAVNWIDAAILLVFFWFGFTGFATGLLRSSITLLAFVLGIVLAGLFYQRLSNDVRLIVSNDVLVRVISLLAIWLATAIAGELLAAVLKQTASLFFFGPLDGLGGLVMGLAKAFVLVELILVVLVEYRSQSGLVADSLGRSLLVPYFLRDFTVLLRFLPAEFQSAAGQFLNLPH